jgi:hypothetical protein
VLVTARTSPIPDTLVCEYGSMRLHASFVSHLTRFDNARKQYIREIDEEAESAYKSEGRI